MISLKTCAIFATAVSFAVAMQNVAEYEMYSKEEVKVDIVPLWSKMKQVLSIATPVKVKEFKWTDCGGADSLAHIKSLSINNPVYEPGPLTISTVVDVTTALDKLKAALQIFRKIDGVYEKMPCVADIGSCNYPDLCDLLEQLITVCPPSLTAIDLTCKCPIKQNTYTLSDVTFQIDAAVFTGDFHFIGNVTTKSGKEAVCLDFYLKLE